MALKHILLSLDSRDDTPHRIDIATRLAKPHGAHLTGLYVGGESTRPLPGGGTAGLTEQLREAVEAMQTMESEGRAAAVNAFNDATRTAGISAECLIEEGRAGQIPLLVHHARTADLVVLGKDGATTSGAAHDVLFGGGVPVIVVPRLHEARIGERVAIAWNGSREAARAVKDALPILERAGDVTILCVNQAETGRNAQPGDDLARHLSHHGIRARVDNTTRKGQAVGDALISRLADLGADLVVMGAWGHSRLREFVLGGVTRRVLEQSPVPVLMSH